MTNDVGARGGSAKLKEIAGFEIISKLGQGGMGAVYKARQVTLDRIVALKVLPPSIAKDASFIERFQREARASARLNHPNIVQGIDVGKDPATGLWYFAMEFIDGPSLRKVLDEKSVLPETQALEYTRDVARALEMVAANRMIHRDIKPDNILIGEQGEAKLADLGLAKQLNDDSSLTQSGQTVGTPYYMPPELARGQSKDCDIRTDIYSLGATLFHLVTGKPPFTGDTAAVIMVKHLTDAPPKASKVNPNVSDACSRLIEKMMQKKQDQRVQTPTDLIAQIEKILRGEVNTAKQVVHKTTGPRVPISERKRESNAKKSPVGLILAGVGVLAVIAVAALLLKGNKTPAPVVDEPKKTDPMPIPTVSATKSTPPDSVKASAPAVAAKVVEAPKPAAPDPEAIFKAADEQAQGLLAAGNIDGAIHVLQTMPPSATNMAARAKERVAAIQKEAQEKIAAQSKLADQMLDENRMGDAGKILRALDVLAFAEGRASVEAVRKRVTERIAQAAETQKAATAQDSQVTEAVQKFEQALLDAKDLKLAGDVAESAKKLDSAKPPVRAMSDVMAAYDEIAKFEADELTKRVGQKLEITTVNGLTHKGTLARVQDGSLVLEQSDKGITASKKLKIADIVDDQRKKLTPAFAPKTDAQRLAVCYQKLAKGSRDFAAAYPLLDEAKEFPLTARARVIADEQKLEKEKGATEVAAPKAWAELAAKAVGKLSEADAKSWLERFAKFETDFGATEFAVTNKEKIEAARLHVHRILHPNIVANGDFEKGTHDGWVKSGGSDSLVVQKEHAHGGKHAALIDIQRDYFGAVTQTLTVEPKAEYKMSCWIKHVKGSLEQGRGGMFILGEAGERPREEDPNAMPVLAKAKLGEWVYVEGRFKAHSPTVQFQFFLRQTSRAEERFTMVVDDLEVSRVGD